jgi:hypothetical protein
VAGAEEETVSEGLSPDTIERRIRAYEAFGIHRTGWPGDDGAAAWMRDELASMGIAASLEPFPFPRVEVRRAVLSWPDGSIEGVPLHDGGFTPPGGIEGTLVGPDSDELFGNIVVTAENDAAFQLRDVPEQVERLEAEGAVALVLVRGDPEGEITTLNAERIERPFKLPVLQVAARNARSLAAAMILGVDGVVEVDGDRLQSRASNTVATLPGADSEAAPVGIMTPRSGWFTCASERGGGIAILLGLAEALAADAARRRPVELVASSGHELHHQGLQAYLKARPGIETRASPWLHLGANIGTSTGPVRVESNTDDLRAQAESAMREAGVERFEVITQKGGEARNIDEAGGRYVSLRGGNDYFHSPNDVFDAACDAELATAAGRAALAMVEAWLEE